LTRSLICTNAEKNPKQSNRAPSPPFSPSEPTLEEVEKRIMRHVLHLEEYQSSLCRFFMHLYNAMRDRANPDPFMTPEELSSYMNWLGDRPRSVGEENDNVEAQSIVGNMKKPEEEGVAKATVDEVANAEETDVETRAEAVVEVVAETAVEVVKKTAKTTEGVEARKKDQPGPSRRTLRLRRAKTGSKPAVTQYVISSDSSSEQEEELDKENSEKEEETDNEEIEKEDDGGNESDDEEESNEDTERLEGIGSEAEEEFDTTSGEF